jgi:predicted helicase
MTALAIETETGPLTTLMKAFQEALVHDLDDAGFADMYAQTIAYGLLSARIADPERKTADDFAAHMRTNPFLKELMETFLLVGGRRGKAGGPGIDFDELGVSEVLELLDDPNTHMGAIVRDFGDRNPQEDPVIHFYELFLKEYDAKKRMQRGVFYTPRPVVSYIVRSVDELLRTEFGLADGLADTATWGEMVKRRKDLKIPDGASPEQGFVQILDPATGTGTFLVEVIDVIYKTLVEKWRAKGHGEKKIQALWNDYVPRHLLTRLHGYELLMAPYAIAHLKIGLKLYETGYSFDSDERARVYLTNTLEPASDQQLTLSFLSALAHEAQAVNKIKRTQRFTVVIGNPPYSNFGRLNKIPSILKLLDEYKRGLNEKKLNLDDDFIKFVRWSQYVVDYSGAGVLGMITNNVYYDGITHRRMRQSMLESFCAAWILNLHGSTKRSEKSPDGLSEENVFDITVGVGIGIFLKGFKRASELHVADLWGSRVAKYAFLTRESLRSCRWAAVELLPPHYFFKVEKSSGGAEYGEFEQLPDVFHVFGNGIGTDRDQLFYDIQRSALVDRIRRFFSSEGLSEKFSHEYGVRDSSSYPILARRSVTTFSETQVQECLYRPFDCRWLYYDPVLTSRPARDVMQHMVANNIALLVTRQVSTGNFRHIFVSNRLTDRDPLSVATRERTQVFPLYQRIAKESLGTEEIMVSNLNVAFLRKLSSALTKATNSQYEDSIAEPKDVFWYAYATFHSPTYRARYTEFLKIDFPRIPVPGSLDLFRKLARLGGELVALHLMESHKLERFGTTYTGPKNPQVGRVGWSDGTVWLDAAATRRGQPTRPGTIGFHNVPEEVWSFHIGGYQICQKWLKDRKGRTLSKDDIAHYQKIVVALAETIRIMQKIDEVIDEHGGWPKAFMPAGQK